MRVSRRTIRYGAAAIAAATALVYFLIGLGVLKVVTEEPEDMSMLLFGGGAGSMFLLGAILLVVFDRRVLWILGAILQVLVMAAYVNVAPTRTPAFEIWGIALRVIQVPLLGALVYLSLKTSHREDRQAMPARRRIQ
jgi:hypothetical protein